MVQLTYQDLEINDFSGGITDKYIDGMPNECKELDNFVLNEVGLPEIRNGFKVAYERETTQRIMGMFLLDDRIIVSRGDQMWLYDDVSAIAQIQTPNLTQGFFRYSASDIYPHADEWRNHLLMTNSGNESLNQFSSPMFLYKNEFGNHAAVEVGLPAYVDDSGLTFIPVSGADTEPNKYIYNIHYSYEYKVGSTTFRMVGATKIFEYYSSVEIDATNTVDLGNIDVLSGTGNQLDVSNIKVEIYRTQNNSSTYYKIGEIPNGQTTFTDNFTDEQLEAFETIYSSGSVVDFSKPPKCRFAFVVNDTAYYCSVVEETDGGEEYRPYRFVQSIPGAPSGVFESAFEELDDDITGGAGVNGLPVIFTNSYIYRIEGSIDINGDGVIRKRVISDTIGCVSHNSIINIGKRLMFAGNDGFYVTDGYKVELITPRLTRSYRELVSDEARASRITATYDNTEERVYWAVTDGDTENNKWWCYNLKTGGFTTGSGISFYVTALLERNGSIYRGDELGYIYEHNDTLFSDLIRDISTPSSDWETTHIPFRLETVSYNFGNSGIRKWTSTATVTTKTSTKFAYKSISNNDDADRVADMTPVRLFDRCFWDDPNCVWDDAEIFWKFAKTEAKQRHFPRNHSRCFRKQLAIEPAKVVRFKSDIFGKANVTLLDPLDPTTLVITIQTGVWPDNIVGDSIRFADDNYLGNFTIESRNPTQLICRGGGITPGNDKDWDIFGYNREQRAEVKSIVFKYTPLSREGNKYQKESAGGNA